MGCKINILGTLLVAVFIQFGHWTNVIVCSPQNSNSTAPRFVINFNPIRPSSRNYIPTTQTAPPIPPGIQTTTRRPGTTPSKTISQIKCEEYSRLVKKDIPAVMPLFLDATPIKATVPKCVINGQPLIVGGQETLVGEFPHMAALGYTKPNSPEYEFMCGGSLISEDAVLTAAHCTRNRDYGTPVMVRVGEHNIKNADPRAKRQDINIKDIIIHENYHAAYKYYDIAIFKLENPVRIDDFARPACLWQNPEVGKADLIVTGWGQTRYSGQLSYVLQKVTIPIIEQRMCKRNPQYAKSLPDGVRDEQLCIGVAMGGRDSCQGDSGGPLQIVDDNNPCVYHLVGITSFGVGCAFPKSIAINTRVSSYIPWIENIVWPGQ